MEKLLIACDHGGYELKEAIKSHFSDSYEFIDLGANSTDSVDYLEFGNNLALAIKEGRADRGILICGSGIGISIAANRHAHIRAALCTDVTMAKLTRLHNDANVLALGARIIGNQVALDITDTFLKTEYEGGRHDRRVSQLSEICS